MLTSATRRIAVLSAAFLAGSLLAGCGALADDSETDDSRVVAAFYPLHYVSARVAGDGLEVTNLTNVGGEPHDLELTVQQTAAVSDAGVVVLEHGFQPAVDAAVEKNAKGMVVDVAEVVDLKARGEHHEEHDGEEAHAEGDVDPHFWLDPLLMAEVGDAIADELGELDPDHAADFTANAAALRRDLERLDGEYVDGLGACARDIVVVNHDAFGYLSRYGLHFEPIAGLSPDAEPTISDLARLQDLIRDEGITTVFSESLVSPKTAETLAGDLGIRADVLDPIEGLSDDTAEEDYLSLMRTNLDRLREANGC